MQNTALEKEKLRRAAEQFYKSGINFEKENLIKDAVEMWRKTLEIDVDHAGAITKLEQYGELEPLICSIKSIEDVYTSIYKYYADHPFGIIEIENKDQTVLKDFRAQDWHFFYTKTYKIQYMIFREIGAENYRRFCRQMAEKSRRTDLSADYIMELL